MNRKMTSIVLCSLALGLVIVLPGARAQLRVDQQAASFEPVNPVEPDREAIWNPFFASRIAGTYYSPAGTMSLHADGTLTAASKTCCGGQNPPNQQSEALGNWVRTGYRQIELSGVIYVYHDEGGPAVCVASQQLDFAQDYQSYTGVAVTACWYEDPDDCPVYATNCVGGPLPDVMDPNRRDPDLCTWDLSPDGFLIPVAGARLPVEFPACGELP